MSEQKSILSQLSELSSYFELSLDDQHALVDIREQALDQLEVEKDHYIGQCYAKVAGLCLDAVNLAQRVECLPSAQGTVIDMISVAHFWAAEAQGVHDYLDQAG